MGSYQFFTCSKKIKLKPQVQGSNKQLLWNAHLFTFWEANIYFNGVYKSFWSLLSISDTGKLNKILNLWIKTYNMLLLMNKNKVYLHKFVLKYSRDLNFDQNGKRNFIHSFLEKNTLTKKNLKSYRNKQLKIIWSKTEIKLYKALCNN